MRSGVLEGVVLAVWRDSEREADGVQVPTGESHRALSAPLVPAAPLPCRTVFARRIIGGVIYVVPSADAACCRELSRRSRLRAVAISVLATPEVSVVALPAVASARCLLPVYEDNRASPHAQEAVGKSEGSCWLVWLRDADVVRRGDWLDGPVRSVVCSRSHSAASSGMRSCNTNVGVSWRVPQLPRNYTEALQKISQELEYWPKALVHRNKQRLTKIHQYLIRMRKLTRKLR